jgi:hypothetical protein
MTMDGKRDEKPVKGGKVWDSPNKVTVALPTQRVITWVICYFQGSQPLLQLSKLDFLLTISLLQADHSLVKFSKEARVVVQVAARQSHPMLPLKRRTPGQT